MYTGPIEVGGVKLNNMFIMESGPFGHSGESIVKCTNAGFGAVSTETISLEDGSSPNWHIYPQKNTLYNCSRWSDISPKHWASIEIPYAKKANAVVIASVGHRVEDVLEIVPMLEQAKADAIKLVSYNSDSILPMLEAAKKITKLPVWVKISANWSNYVEIAKQCQRLGAQALVAIDTLGPVKFMAKGDIPALGNSSNTGWISGEAIHGQAVYAVSQLWAAVKLPIVGVGGIMDSDGVIRMIKSGASAVGLCSAVILNGLGALNDIKQGLNSITSFATAETNDVRMIQINEQLCSRCFICVECCGYMALQKSDSSAIIVQENKCRRCGLCYRICQNSAITIR